MRDLKRIGFEFYLWQYAPGTNFTCMLFDLIAKADGFNKERLRAGFPTHVQIFEAWQRAKDMLKFWSSLGLADRFQGEKNASNGR